ncbi:MAG: hypothetical protein QXG05_01520 [Nitrososphaerota archaeon]
MEGKEKKAYLKIHFDVKIKTKYVISIDVSSQRLHCGKLLKWLFNRAKENVRVEEENERKSDPKTNFNFL